MIPANSGDGVIVTDAWGASLAVPLDTNSPVTWIGYANETQRGEIAPVLTRPLSAATTSSLGAAPRAARDRGPTLGPTLGPALVGEDPLLVAPDCCTWVDTIAVRLGPSRSSGQADESLLERPSLSILIACLVPPQP